jgi:hypothetical protein
MLLAALGSSKRHRGLNHEYMAQPGGLRRPLRGAGRKENRTAKQPKSRADHIGLTQANRPPRKPVRFRVTSIAAQSPSMRLDVRQMPSGVRRSINTPTRSWLSIAHTQRSMRSASSSSIASRTPSGPLDSSACTFRRRPAVPARLKDCEIADQSGPKAASFPSIGSATTRGWRKSTSSAAAFND